MADLRRQALDIFGDLVDPDSRDEIERALRVVDARHQLNKEIRDAGTSRTPRAERGHRDGRPRD